MWYVYIIRSTQQKDQTYIGFTCDVQQRLETHNSGGSVYTKNLRPWILIASFGFVDESHARKFEKYMKSHAGRALGKKHFLTD